MKKEKKITMKKKAPITGVTGQDGSYLVEFYLKNYEVHGIKRRSSSLNTQRVDHLYQDLHDNNPRFFMHYGIDRQYKFNKTNKRY